MGSRWPQTYTYTSERSASSGILNPLKHDAKVEMTGFHLRGREMNEWCSIWHNFCQAIQKPTALFKPYGELWLNSFKGRPLPLRGERIYSLTRANDS